MLHQFYKKDNELDTPPSIVNVKAIGEDTGIDMSVLSTDDMMTLGTIYQVIQKDYPHLGVSHFLGNLPNNQEVFMESQRVQDFCHEYEISMNNLYSLRKSFQLQANRKVTNIIDFSHREDPLDNLNQNNMPLDIDDPMIHVSRQGLNNVENIMNYG